eukprot:scaffold597_cov242-Prasinococcus_capsulatus_cf.AAC.8
MIVASRKHYTVDVVIAWYTVPLMFGFVDRQMPDDLDRVSTEPFCKDGTRCGQNEKKDRLGWNDVRKDAQQAPGSMELPIRSGRAAPDSMSEESKSGSMGARSASWSMEHCALYIEELEQENASLRQTLALRACSSQIDLTEAHSRPPVALYRHGVAYL